MTIAAILRHKGADVASVRPADTIAAVASLLSRHRIGAVVVQDEAGHLHGILSERDIVHGLARHGAEALALTAERLMTSDIKTATREMSVEQAMGMMTLGRFRHLPVVENGKLLGIVSIGDIVKSRLEQQAQEVDSLKAYVAGAA